ncbi:MAG: universal stress protein [Sandaracinaceae bacterium]|nr:universal stress protein [Sandaracinaceae bacterium]MDW8246120.1 universal stress protein [Sandaracinaceae bacterium]
MRTIVCAIDFSEPSERALAHAIELAKVIGAKVLAVHAWQLPVYAVPDGLAVFGPELVSEITTGLHRQLDETVMRYRGHGVEVEGRLVSGSPVEAILELAESVDAQYLVIGTHGRTGVARLLIGSVAERFVRLSTIPVVVIPSRERKKQNPGEASTA